MPKPISKKLLDQTKIFSYLSRYIKREMLMRDKQSKEVAAAIGINPQYLSGVLGTRPTNNAEVYRNIARGIGLSNSEFDSLVDQATREAYGGNENNLDYAISSDLGNNPDAVKEVMGFMDFVKQKYGIK